MLSWNIFRSISFDRRTQRLRSISPITFQENVKADFLISSKSKINRIHRRSHSQPPENFKRKYLELNNLVPTYRRQSKSSSGRSEAPERKDNEYVEETNDERNPSYGISRLAEQHYRREARIMPKLQPQKLTPYCDSEHVSSSNYPELETERPKSKDAVSHAKTQYKKAITKINKTAEKKTYQYELESCRPRKVFTEKNYDVFDYFTELNKNRDLRVMPHLQPGNLKPYGTMENLLFPTHPKKKHFIVEYPDIEIFPEKEDANSNNMRSIAKREKSGSHQRREFSSSPEDIKQCENIIAEHRKLNPGYKPLTKLKTLIPGSEDEKQFVENTIKLVSAIKVKQTQGESLANENKVIIDKSNNLTYEQPPSYKKQVMKVSDTIEKSLMVRPTNFKSLSNITNIRNENTNKSETDRENLLTASCNKFDTFPNTDKENTFEGNTVPMYLQDVTRERKKFSFERVKLPLPSIQTTPVTLRVGARLNLLQADAYPESNELKDNIPLKHNERLTVPWPSWSDKVKETKTKPKISVSFPTVVDPDAFKKSLFPAVKRVLMPIHKDKSLQETLSSGMLSKPQETTTTHNKKRYHSTTKINLYNNTSDYVPKSSYTRNYEICEREYETEQKALPNILPYLKRSYSTSFRNLVRNITRLPKVDIPEPERNCKEVEDDFPERADDNLTFIPKKLLVFKPQQCPCVEPEIPAEMKPLSRLQKKRSIDRLWKCRADLNRCPDRADNNYKTKTKMLPKMTPEKCACVEEEIMKEGSPLPRLKKKVELDPPKICKQECPGEDCCPRRADRYLKVRRKQLPVLETTECPRLEKENMDEIVPLQRLEKVEIIEPLKVCQIQEEDCITERADDRLKFNRKRLPVLKSMDYPRVERILEDRIPSFIRLAKVPIPEPKKLCEIEEDVCPERADSNLKPIHKKLPTLEHQMCPCTKKQILFEARPVTRPSKRSTRPSRVCKPKTVIEECPARADEGLTTKSRTLPPITLGECICQEEELQEGLPLERPRRHNSTQKPKKECKTECFEKDCCPPRADQNYVVQKKILPLLEPESCPCVEEEIVGKDIRLPRLQKKKLPEPQRTCNINEIPCPLRSDDNIIPRKKQLPTLEIGTCPCIEDGFMTANPPESFRKRRKPPGKLKSGSDDGGSRKDRIKCVKSVDKISKRNYNTDSKNVKGILGTVHFMVPKIHHSNHFYQRICKKRFKLPRPNERASHIFEDFGGTKQESEDLCKKEDKCSERMDDLMNYKVKRKILPKLTVEKCKCSNQTNQYKDVCLPRLKPRYEYGDRDWNSICKKNKSCDNMKRADDNLAEPPKVLPTLRPSKCTCEDQGSAEGITPELKSLPKFEKTNHDWNALCPEEEKCTPKRADDNINGITKKTLPPLKPKNCACVHDYDECTVQPLLKKLAGFEKEDVDWNKVCPEKENCPGIGTPERADNLKIKPREKSLPAFKPKHCPCIDNYNVCTEQPVLKRLPKFEKEDIDWKAICAEHEPCPETGTPERADDSITVTKIKALPLLKRSKCPCKDNYNENMVLPELKRLPKCKLEDIDWNTVCPNDEKCPGTGTPERADDEVKPSKMIISLPSLKHSKCPCIDNYDKYMKQPILKKLPKFKKEDIDWETVCLKEEQCLGTGSPQRADDSIKTIKKKSLPCLKPYKCPCVQSYNKNTEQPTYKRLPKFKKEDIVWETVCPKEEKCLGMMRADDLVKTNVNKISLPPLKSNKCPCIKSYDEHMKQPKLKRLPKFKKGDVDWDILCSKEDKCPGTRSPVRADDFVKPKKMSLPLLKYNKCPCIENYDEYTEQPELKRLPKIKKEDINWDTFCPKEDKCAGTGSPVRADDVVKPSTTKTSLPVLKSNKCPCIESYDEHTEQPELKRLPKIKKEDIDWESSCPEEDKCPGTGSPVRADDLHKTNTKKMSLPLLKSNKCPCIESYVKHTEQPRLQRLKKIKKEDVDWETLCPKEEKCPGTCSPVRADDLTKTNSTKMSLPPLNSNKCPCIESYDEHTEQPKLKRLQKFKKEDIDWETVYPKEEKCPSTGSPMRADDLLKTNTNKMPLPPLKSTKCPCIESYDKHTEQPKLQRLPKFKKEDNDWESVCPKEEKCPGMGSPMRADDLVKTNTNKMSLPPLKPDKCPCIDSYDEHTEQPELKRLPKIKKEDIDWETVCPTEDKCPGTGSPMRADDLDKINTKKITLPPLKSNKCPCIGNYVEHTEQPRLKRLKKVKNEDLDWETICPKEEKCPGTGSPVRADDLVKTNTKKMTLPPLKSEKCPCIETYDEHTEQHKLKRLQKFKKEDINWEIVCPKEEKCPGTGSPMRVDNLVKTNSNKMPLPPLKSTKCTCIESYDKHTVQPKLKRLPKFKKEDIDWESVCPKEDKCPGTGSPARTNDLDKTDSKKISLPRLKPNKCPCTEGYKQHMEHPKLPRLPKFKKEDIDWDTVCREKENCPGTGSPQRADNSATTITKNLPPFETSKCPCIGSYDKKTKQPKIKRLPKFKKEYVCGDTVCPKEEKCPGTGTPERADDAIRANPKKLPPFKPSKSPCVDNYDESTEQPRLERLQKFKKEGIDSENVCPKQEKCPETGTPARVGDLAKTNNKKVSVPPLTPSKCPCVENDDEITKHPVLKSLPTHKEEDIDCETVCPKEEEYPGTCTPVRADDSVKTCEKKISLPSLKLNDCACVDYHNENTEQPKLKGLSGKTEGASADGECDIECKKVRPMCPPQSKKSYSTSCLYRKTSSNPFLSMPLHHRMVSTSMSALAKKPDKLKKSCRKPNETRDKPKCPKLSMPGCKSRARYSCHKKKVWKCKKQNSPYPSFSECKDDDLEENISECSKFTRHLQPRYPILSNIATPKPPPPYQGIIDPLKEHYCVIKKLGLKKGGTKDCENFNEPEKPLLTNKLLLKAQAEAEKKVTQDKCQPSLVKGRQCPEDDSRSKEDEKSGKSCTNEVSKKRENKLTLWDKICAYFKARPNCPSPDEWKKRKLREEAEQAASKAGLQICEQEEALPKVVTIKDCQKEETSQTCSKTDTENEKNLSKKTAKDSVKSGPSVEKAEERLCDPKSDICKKPKLTKCGSKDVKNELKSEEQERDSNRSGKCKIIPVNCPPRARTNCDKISRDIPPCTTTEAPYSCFSECHPPFPKNPINECTVSERKAKMVNKITYRDGKAKKSKKKECKRKVARRCYSTVSSLGTRSLLHQSRHFSSDSGGKYSNDPFSFFDNITDESIRKMDQKVLAEKILNAVREGMEKLEKNGNVDINNPEYRMYKELKFLSENELKNFEKQQSQFNPYEPLEESIRETLCYACKWFPTIEKALTASDYAHKGSKHLSKQELKADMEERPSTEAFHTFCKKKIFFTDASKNCKDTENKERTDK